MLGKDEKEERWLKLCGEAAVEQDSKKLLDLIAEISALLEEKHKRSVSQKPENERAAINEIITAIEDLSASVGTLRAALLNNQFLDNQYLEDSTGTYATKARLAVKQARQMLQLPRR